MKKLLNGAMLLAIVTVAFCFSVALGSNSKDLILLETVLFGLVALLIVHVLYSLNRKLSAANEKLCEENDLFAVACRLSARYEAAFIMCAANSGGIEAFKKKTLSAVDTFARLKGANPSEDDLKEFNRVYLQWIIRGIEQAMTFHDLEKVLYLAGVDDPYRLEVKKFGNPVCEELQQLQKDIVRVYRTVIYEAVERCANLQNKSEWERNLKRIEGYSKDHILKMVGIHTMKIAVSA